MRDAVEKERGLRGYLQPPVVQIYDKGIWCNSNVLTHFGFLKILNNGPSETGEKLPYELKPDRP